MSGLLPGSSLKQSDKTTRLKSPIKLHFPVSGVSGIHVAPVSFVSAQAGNIKNQKIQGLQETAGPVQLSPGRPHRLLRPSWGPAMRASGENLLQLELEIVEKTAVRTKVQCVQSVIIQKLWSWIWTCPQLQATLPPRSWDMGIYKVINQNLRGEFVKIV